MSTEKKLTRGLPEISPLFCGHRKSISKNGTDREQNRKHSINGTGDEVPPSFVCASMIQFSTQFRPPDVVGLMEHLTTTFDQIFYVTVAPSQSRYEALAQVMFLPAWSEVSSRSDMYLQTINERFVFGYMSATAFQSIIHPALMVQAARGLQLLKKSLVLVDQSSAEVSQHHQDRLHLLDHCVLVVEADANNLTEAYEWLRVSAPEHPGSLYSLLLVGRGAGALWEFIYERFHEMATRFLDRELGFLGWIENGATNVYSDFLLAEAQGRAQHATKRKLFDALSRSFTTNDHVRNCQAIT